MTDTVGRPDGQPGRTEQVVLLIPTLNEAENMPRVGAFAAACLAEGLVHRAVILDGRSQDDTTPAALAAGLEVFPSVGIPAAAGAERTGERGAIRGKGDAVWRAAGSIEADVFVLVDADVEGLSTDAVRDLVAAVRDGAVLAKGSFERLQSHDGLVRPIGGRITEFLVKPLLRQLAPGLDHVTEPLSGQFAVRAEVLRAIPVATGFGLEISLLLEVARRFGPGSIVDVPIGQITHREKDDAALVAMADQITATMLDRFPLGITGAPEAVATDRPLAAGITVRPAWESDQAAALPAWLPSDRLSVMGIVNVNANSFSDSRGSLDLDERATFCRALMDAGADLLDLGAQSARTDIPAEDPADEIAWLTALLGQLPDIPTSIDTYKASVAAACLAAGATIVNDYSGLVEPDLAGLVADAGGWYVLTHNRGRPKQRLTDPGRYTDVMADVIEFFEERLVQCEAAGLARERIILDPGIDLSKTPAQTVEVLRRLPELRAAFGLPHLVAVSRKDFLGAALGRLPRERDPGMLATLPLLAQLDRTIVRVHDVQGVVDHLHVRDLMQGTRDVDGQRLLDPKLFFA